MKGPLTVDDLITSQVDRCKMWAIHFCKNNIGAKIRNPGCMFSRITSVCIYASQGMYEIWSLVCPKMDEIVSLT